MTSPAQPAERRPLLVAIEGPRSAGKTTLTRALHRSTSPVRLIASEACLGARLREVIHDPAADIDPTEELLLYAARLARKARAAVAADADCVVVDRYDLSLIVLGHHVRGLPRSPTQELAALATRGLSPGAVIVMDATYDVHLRRCGSRDAMEGRDGYERWRGGFRNEYERLALPKLWLDASLLPAGEAWSRARSFLRGLDPGPGRP